MGKVIKSLSDYSLEYVSAGYDMDAVVGYGGLVVAGVGACVGLASSIAGKVCRCKAKGKEVNGDVQAAYNLKRAGDILDNVAIGGCGLALAGVVSTGTIVIRQEFFD